MGHVIFPLGRDRSVRRPKLGRLINRNSIVRLGIAVGKAMVNSFLDSTGQSPERDAVPLLIQENIAGLARIDKIEAPLEEIIELLHPLVR